MSEHEQHELDMHNLDDPTDATIVTLDGGGDVMQILEGVEKQFEQLRQIQSEHTHEVESLNQRSELLDLRSRELDERAESLERRQSELEGQRTELDRRFAALDARTEAADEADQQRRRELEHARSKVEQRRAELDDQRESLEQAHTELETLRREFDAEREALRAREQAMGDREAGLAEARAEAERLREALDEAAREREQEVRSLHDQIADANCKLDLAGQKLLQFSQMLNQAGGLPGGGADPAVVAEQTRRIDALTSALDEAQQAAAEAESLRERIGELEDAVADRGDEATMGEAIAALESGQRELVVENQRLASRLEHSQAETELLRAQLESAAQNPAPSEEIAELQERNRMLNERMQALDLQLARARHEARAAEGGESVEARAIKAETERRRMSEADDQLKKREARLAKMKALMNEERKRARVTGERAPIYEEEVRDLRHQQRRLEEHRKMLVEAERQMIRKWARPRAMMVVCCMLVILGVSAAGSWFAANQIAPPQVAATVTVAVSERDAPEDSLALWQRWHETVLYNTDFHGMVAERMNDRLLEPYRSPSAVTQLIVNELGVDATHAGELTLSLYRSNPDEAVMLLDVVATTLADAGRLQQETREDGLGTIVHGDVGQGDDVYYARLSPTAIVDDRLLYGGGIFGGALLGCLLVAGAASTWLGRARPSLAGNALTELEASYLEAHPSDAETLKPLM